MVHETAPRPALAQQTSEQGSTDRFYKPELDVLRFLAFLMVFTFHVHGLLPPYMNFLSDAGDAGVPVFFVLSSYLIGELLLREKEKTGFVDLRRFYARRILRIWPLYFLLLFGAYAYSSIAGNGSLPIKALAAYILLSGNLYVVATGWPKSVVAVVLWTVSIEEQFYLLAPFVWSRAARAGVFLFSACTIGLSYLVLLVHLVGGGTDPQVWCSSLVQFQYFALGMILALMLHGRTVRLPFWTRACFIVFAFILFASARSLFHFREYPVGWHTAGGYLSLGAGAVVLLTAFLDSRIFCGSKRLIYLGRISYGLYAYHLLIQSILATHMKAWIDRVVRYPHGFWIASETFYFATLALTILAAGISYRFFEKPFLRWKARLAAIPSQPVADDLPFRANREVAR